MNMEYWKVGRLEGWFFKGFYPFSVLSPTQILPLTFMSRRPTLHYPMTHYSNIPTFQYSNRGGASISI
jgi:hypothetical protein